MKLEEMGSKLEFDYQLASQEFQKLNVLVVGASGVGKSSLVNAVIGSNVAEVGNGKPITQKVTCYSSDSLPIVIYDTKGLEQGRSDSFVKDIKSFLDSCKEAIQQQIHCVWYVLDLSQSRFQPYEAELCYRLFSHLPIIFVLNKQDTANIDSVNQIMSSITTHNIQNVLSISPVVSCRKNFEVTKCTSCGGVDLVKKQKKGKVSILCSNCKTEIKTDPTQGLDELIENTCRSSSLLIKTSFFHLYKRKLSKKNILIQKVVVDHLSKSVDDMKLLEKRLLDVTNKLLELLDLQFANHLLQKEIPIKLSEVIGLSDRFFLFFQSDFYVSVVLCFAYHILLDLVSYIQYLDRIFESTEYVICQRVRRKSSLTSQSLKENENTLTNGDGIPQAELQVDNSDDNNNNLNTSVNENGIGNTQHHHAPSGRLRLDFFSKITSEKISFFHSLLKNNLPLQIVVQRNFQFF